MYGRLFKLLWLLVKGVLVNTHVCNGVYVQVLLPKNIVQDVNMCNINNPANTRRATNVGLMLVQYRRRWANNKLALSYLGYAILYAVCIIYQRNMLCRP